MKHSCLQAFYRRVAAVLTLICATPAAVFEAVPSNDNGWVDVVGDDGFYAEDEIRSEHFPGRIVRVHFALEICRQQE